MIPHSKVFVGGLPTGSKPHELRRLFENYGIVTECDVRNHCGFVHMEDPRMADNAIRALHNTFFKGAAITVEPGRFKDRNSGGAGNDGGIGRGGPSGSGGGPSRRMGDEDNMSSGPPRDNFGNARGSGFGGPGGPRGGNMIRGGPVRRDRGRDGDSGNQRRDGPYNRGGRGGGENFNDNFQGRGGHRGFDTNSGPNNFNNNPINEFVSGNDNIHMGSFGGGGGGGSFGNYEMGNQDTRGFALPDESFSNNSGSMMGSNQDMATNQGGPGGFSNSTNTFNRPGRGGGGGMTRGRGGFGTNTNNYNRPLGENINTNQSEGQFGGQNRRTTRFGPSGNQGSGNGGNGGDFSNNQNYNESFPPLGAQRGHNINRPFVDPGMGGSGGGGSSGFYRGRGSGGFNRGRGGGSAGFNRGGGGGGFNRGGDGGSAGFNRGGRGSGSGGFNRGDDGGSGGFNRGGGGRNADFNRGRGGGGFGNSNGPPRQDNLM